MGKKHAGGGWADIEAQAEAALTDPPADALAFVRLIHEVNPTGRQLPEPSARKRYQLKARLQSMFVVRHRDALAVERDGAEADTVTLRHLPSGKDACHAVIEELDDEARSVVRFVLDQGPAAAVPSPEPTRPVGRRATSAAPARADRQPASLVAAAREALEEYDFERARSCLEEALEASAGAAEAARPLLELLVDQLGDDAAALALEPELDEDASNAPDLRALLALAAARCADPDAARRLLVGADAPRAAEACVALARLALGRQDAPEAERLLEEARRLDPAQPDVVSLLDEVSRARQASSRSLEDSLEEAVGRGDDAESERLAREVLERWPGSALARGVLRDLADRKRAADARAREHEAQSALAAGDFERAARLFQEAADQGAAGLTEKVALATRLAAERNEEQALAKVGRAVSSGDTEGSLGAYLELEASPREKARALYGLSAFEWAEQLGPVRGASQQRAAVAALLALGRAEQHAAEPEEALRLLAPHEERLSSVPRATGLVRRARAELAERERRKAQALLAEAQQAMSSGRAATAAELLGRARLTALSDEERAVARELAAQASASQKDSQRARELQELLAKGALFEALELARETPGADEALREARQRLRAELRLRVVPAGGAPDVDLLATRRSLEEGACWLDGAGERVYAAVTHRRWVFLRVLRADSGKTETLVSLRAPEPMDFATTWVGPDTVQLVAESGSVLELALGSFDVVRWRTASALCAEGELTEQALCLPGSRFLWVTVETRSRSGPTRVHVVDLDRKRLHRELGPLLSMHPVLAAPEPRVLGTELDRNGRLLAQNGAQLLALDGARVTQAAAHPSGAGLIGLTTEYEEESDAGPLGLTLISPEGRCAKPLVLEGSWNESQHLLVTASEPGLAYVAFDAGEDGPSLAAFRPTAAGLDQAFRSQLPAGTALIQDLLGRRAMLLAPAAEGLQAHRLGEKAPELAPGPPEFPRTTLLRGASSLLCTPWSEDAKAREAARAALEKPPNARARAVEAFRAEHEGDPDVLLTFGEWLGMKDKESEEAILRFVWERHAGVPKVELHRAQRELRGGSFDAALARLERFGPEGLPAKVARHLCHLHGLAFLSTGRLEEALATFRTGAALEGDSDSCGLSEWAELTAELVGRGGAAPSPVAKVVRQIRLADKHLAAGNFGAARAELDRWEIWSANETQGLARLAEAYLLDVEPQAEGRMRKAFVLAAYLAERAFARGQGEGLALAGLAWTADRLADVDRRAADWLEREG